MYEFEEFEYEFSKIYKRLLRLELLIKKKITICSSDFYGENVMNQFSKFFNNSKIYGYYSNDRKNRNYFLSIRDNADIPYSVKFSEIINLLTLRHLLHFIFTEESFRVPDIASKFYIKENINFKELKNAKQSLIELRNDIAHFDFNDYKKNKTRYLYSLLLYEICIGCSLGKYNNIPNDLGNKPSMTVIIEKIYDLCPELFKKDMPHSAFPYNKDRIIVDMYEEIAVLNGYQYSELKSQWDVIREKYRLANKKSEEEDIHDLDIEGQIPLFDEINFISKG